MRIRKQVDKLTLVDLESCPIWEFALDEEGEDGQDGCTVRPYKMPLNGRLSEGVIIKAEFILADGTKLIGHITYRFLQGKKLNLISTLSPVIVTDGGAVGFWFGILSADVVRVSEYYRMLEKEASQVFPITFRSSIQLDTPIEGQIEGFYFIVREDDTIRKMFKEPDKVKIQILK